MLNGSLLCEAKRLPSPFHSLMMEIRREKIPPNEATLYSCITVRVANPSLARQTICLPVTKAINSALKMVDVCVLDYIIVAGTHTHSFAEHGQI